MREIAKIHDLVYGHWIKRNVQQKKGNLPLVSLGLFIVLRFFSDGLSSFQMHTRDRVFFCLENYIFF